MPVSTGRKAAAQIDARQPVVDDPRVRAFALGRPDTAIERPDLLADDLQVVVRAWNARPHHARLVVQPQEADRKNVG